MEDKVKVFPKRKPTRLKNFDYSSNGVYFVTICTKDRKQILSKIVGGDAHIAPRVELTNYGKIVDNFINSINNSNKNITV